MQNNKQSGFKKTRRDKEKKMKKLGIFHKPLKVGNTL